MFKPILFVLLSICVWKTEATCGTCNPAGHACISKDRYQLCSNNAVTGSILTCAAGSYCTTTKTCDSNSATITPDCPCMFCKNGGTLNFACVSNTQYVDCSGSILGGTVMTCPSATKYCNFGGTTYCTATAPASPYCISEATTCAASGRLPVVNTGCKNYFVCGYANSVWSMYLYNCLGTTLFNPNSLVCQDGYTCPTA